jgi:hypothetical protein
MQAAEQGGEQEHGVGAIAPNIHFRISALVAAISAFSSPLVSTILVSSLASTRSTNFQFLDSITVQPETADDHQGKRRPPTSCSAAPATCYAMR